MRLRQTRLRAGLAAALLALTALPTAAEEVNLYSYRQPFLIQPIIDRFVEETGIDVNIVYADAGVLERLQAEGANSPADAVLTVDIGRLNDLVQADLLQPIESDELSRNIPAQYRHPEGLWFGLTTRARVFFVSEERVSPGEITSYEDLATSALNDRICIRSGKHVYNVSLFASMIAHKGRDEARDWLAEVKDNLARKPQGNDRAQAKAIKEGVCDVAVANTYYYGLMATNDQNPEQKEWAEAVRIVFPNQNDRGAHVNISGAGVTKTAKNRDNAIRLIEYLSGDDAQHLYARLNLEYPVKPGVELHELVASWGEFKADPVNLSEVADLRDDAARMVDEVGFNL